ncbi:AMP-binding protein [Nonomuraea sp. NPDC001831]|uniref:AMP-binding protein n=1 Tax=Nonomuraea sp. NPDC001831 TaxID=3364340 RepID=UPI0036A96D31
MTPSASSSGTVIHEVFRRAYERGERPALIDLRGGHVYGYRSLVTEVTRAASGLVRRGARRDQVVGVHVSTTGTQTVALHTVLAAGGVAAPIGPGLGAEEVAALLRECDARMLITTPDLAETAIAAADGSRVRQVVSLGPALDTIDFRGLLVLEPTALPALDAERQDALALPGGARLTHADLLARMAELDGPVGLTESDVVLCTWPPGAGADLPALVGLAVSKGALVVAAARGDLPGSGYDAGVTVLTGPAGTLRRVG